MKRSKFDERQDQNAVVANYHERDLLCAADGCPLQWSVKKESSKGLCTYHAWSDAHSWPRITQEVLDEQANQARRNGEPKPEPKRVDRHAAIEALRTVLNRADLDPKAWAKRLREREEGGERLKPIQRKAWREVLVERPSDEWMEPA